MSLDADYLALVEQIRAGLSLPAVQRLYFPCLTTEGFRDEFGFVLLTTGDVGAFYVSLEDSLAELWQAYPQPEQVQVPLDTLLAKLASSQLAERALGLGAFNALSQYVFRLAHYQAPSRQRAANTSTEHTKLGMVGYFCPLVEWIRSGRFIFRIQLPCWRYWLVKLLGGMLAKNMKSIERIIRAWRLCWRGFRQSIANHHPF